MTLQENITTFDALGKRIQESLQEEEFNDFLVRVRNVNSWFIPENVRFALYTWAQVLTQSNLETWLEPYALPQTPEKIQKIGIVTAGNIPLVGFHDLLCVLLTGNDCYVKCSSNDTLLMTFIRELLLDIEPRLADRLLFVEKLSEFDVVIATGSNNTSRYFEYYFRNVPHIIRKNRTSVAVLTGKETSEDLHNLGTDIFQYFGLGCRNVSKLFVPEGYDFKPLIEHFEDFRSVSMHHKYFNNFEYNLTLALMNKIPYTGNDFVTLVESTDLRSSIGVVYYEFYTDKEQLEDRILSHAEHLQCVVAGSQTVFVGAIPFGKSQCPELSDYADQIDTIAFLQGC